MAIRGKRACCTLALRPTGRRDQSKRASRSHGEGARAILNLEAGSHSLAKRKHLGHGFHSDFSSLHLRPFPYLQRISSLLTMGTVTIGRDYFEALLRRYVLQPKPMFLFANRFVGLNS